MSFYQKAELKKKTCRIGGFNVTLPRLLMKCSTASSAEQTACRPPAHVYRDLRSNHSLAPVMCAIYVKAKQPLITFTSRYFDKKSPMQGFLNELSLDCILFMLYGSAECIMSDKKKSYCVKTSQYSMFHYSSMK